MMFELCITSKFKQDAKKYKHDKIAQQAIKIVLDLLATGKELPPQYKEHSLINNYVNYLECHTRPDLLLIYQRDLSNKCIKLYRLGTRSHLFKK